MLLAAPAAQDIGQETAAPEGLTAAAVQYCLEWF